MCKRKKYSARLKGQGKQKSWLCDTMENLHQKLMRMVE